MCLVMLHILDSANEGLSCPDNSKTMVTIVEGLIVDSSDIIWCDCDFCY